MCVVSKMPANVVLPSGKPSGGGIAECPVVRALSSAGRRPRRRAQKRDEPCVAGDAVSMAVSGGRRQGGAPDLGISERPHEHLVEPQRVCPEPIHHVVRVHHIAPGLADLVGVHVDPRGRVPPQAIPLPRPPTPPPPPPPCHAAPGAGVDHLRHQIAGVRVHSIARSSTMP